MLPNRDATRSGIVVVSTKYLAITCVPHYSRRFLNFQLRYLLENVHKIPKKKKVSNVSYTATIGLSLI